MKAGLLKPRKSHPRLVEERLPQADARGRASLHTFARRPDPGARHPRRVALACALARSLVPTPLHARGACATLPARRLCTSTCSVASASKCCSYAKTGSAPMGNARSLPCASRPGSSCPVSASISPSVSGYTAYATFLASLSSSGNCLLIWSKRCTSLCNDEHSMCASMTDKCGDFYSPFITKHTASHRLRENAALSG